MEDINQVMKIWLDSNIDAHNFIKQEYWISNAPDVKKQLMHILLLHIKQRFQKVLHCNCK